MDLGPFGTSFRNSGSCLFPSVVVLGLGNLTSSSIRVTAERSFSSANYVGFPFSGDCVRICLVCVGLLIKSGFTVVSELITIVMFGVSDTSKL